MTEEKEIYTKICCDCGLEFETESKRTRFCDDCKRKKSAKKSREQSKQFKKPKIKASAVKDGIPIREYTAIVERYNKQHGTSYTYGQFSVLVEAGKIKLEER